MKRLLTISFCVSLVSLVLAAPGDAPQSPQDVVKRFIQLDAEGARLTPEGWREADALFVQSSQMPPSVTLIVIAPHFGVTEIEVTGQTAKFDMGYEELGRIDSAWRFRPSSRGREVRSIRKYDLVLLDPSRQPEKLKQTTQGGNLSSRWKIEGAQPVEVHITAGAAARYLTKMSNETKDPAMKKNAEKSKAALNAYK